ncbi:hypothetical protein [Sphingomonas sp.]|uniref:hypothetical protein n=1 Tax=Sphingomonas sp. TaxID=28214 RepID=UPI001ECE4D1D|nr:hypothetical protein [Sphingomonas sp.]MBX3594744.1 hypothetical protein [Sphingomonas sp.]
MALSLGVAVLGMIAVVSSLSQSFMMVSPPLASAIAPWDGRLAAAYARSFLKTDTKDAEWRRADKIARKALVLDPTAVAAVATLGLAAQKNGNLAAARRDFAYANRLSRRDIQVQLWSIEDAVTRNDVEGALKFYDIALRTSKNTRDILFPILASAIEDEEIRQALVKTFALGPEWAPHFASYAAGEGPDPKSTALFFNALGRRGLAPSWPHQSTLINRLFYSVSVEAAWSLYEVATPDARRDGLRDPAFRSVRGSPSQFDWTPLHDDVIQASILAGGDGGVFEYSAPTGVGGPVLQQILLLPPGKYRLEGRSAGIDQPDDALPYFQLKCREGAELGRIAVSRSATMSGDFSGSVTVPARCPVQSLTLQIRPSDAIAGASGQILRVALRREG